MLGANTDGGIGEGGGEKAYRQQKLFKSMYKIGRCSIRCTHKIQSDLFWRSDVPFVLECSVTPRISACMQSPFNKLASHWHNATYICSVRAV